MAGKKKRSHFRILLIASAVVLFWRGTWGLMDLYIFPGNPLASSVASLVAGLGIIFATESLTENLL